MCDVAEKVELVLECVKGKEHPVRTVVLMQTPSPDLVSRGQQAGIHVLSLQEMEVSRSFLCPNHTFSASNRGLFFSSSSSSSLFELLSVGADSRVLCCLAAPWEGQPSAAHRESSLAFELLLFKASISRPSIYCALRARSHHRLTVWFPRSPPVPRTWPSSASPVEPQVHTQQLPSRPPALLR